ncbi:MAG TPA: Rieske 2Fe-2S domain-containing protein, partial [Polyangiaceae bacterium]|nr:Rieske 2Fe-2S domain-containing protein [Polyangiaceae bacterium]
MYRVAATLGELWSGEMRAVSVGGRRLLLVRMDGQVFAYEDRCVHQGVPLSDGRLEGREIVCNAHEWRYDACTGRGTNPAGAQLRACPVRIEGERVLVDPGGKRAQGREGELRVGPVLNAGPQTEAVVVAICSLNADVEVIDRGAYLRVLVPRLCRVTLEAIQRCGGSKFELPGDLERIMSSFQGRFRVDAA